jgi:fatty-acyl-CoA synthase
MWSEEVKQGLLRHQPKLILTDSLGSSESIGMGRTDTTGGVSGSTAKFTLGQHSCLLSDDGKRVEPGSGVVGRIAVSGKIPLGYYKDPEKTAATFPIVDGVRYAVAGDYATLEADGTLQFLGRGSVCINTGGEKVFPEEVEEALKRHAAVRDAVVVGVPDERFGQAVTAIVEPRTGEAPAPAELIAWVRQSLAAYKSPKQVLLRESLGRAPNGKADYAGLRRWAIERLGGS